MTRIVELHVESAVEPWQRIGLHVVDGAARVGGVVLRFLPGQRGVVAWGLADCPTRVDRIDGLATVHLPPPAGEPTDHPIGIHSWDHLVINTSSLERTCGAIEEATGAELKRIREAGPVRQGFHRLGELVVEVVEHPDFTFDGARFWGFVWNVHDLHDTADRLGPDVIGLPKAAVQPGRFIATVRREVGLPVPLALMTPR